MGQMNSRNSREKREAISKGILFNFHEILLKASWELREDKVFKYFFSRMIRLS